MGYDSSITVNDLVITYKPLNKLSIRKDILHRHQKADPFVAVDHISFDVKKGEILGIIGKNGSGKSTLLRSLAGIFSADEGTIDLHGQTVGLLAIGAGFIPEMSGRENIYIAGLLLGFTKKFIANKEKDITDFADIGNFIDMPVKTYSSGMYSKLAFAITSTLETDILLIDEVLSVGDENFREKSENRMRELIQDKNRTVVVVSHALQTIENLCTSTIWMNRGQIVENGSTDTVVAAYRKAVKEGRV